MFVFKKKYFFTGCSIFLIEVLIALYLNDRFIRPYFGDVLVVIMVYCFVKGFYKVSVIIASLSVLTFAFVIEMAQYFKLINYLGLQSSKIANIILGNTFAWTDILAYIAGIVIVLFAELFKTRLRRKASLRQQQNKRLIFL